MAKPIINLNDYDDEKDLKYDNRGMYIKPNGSVTGVIYMWLSDEHQEYNDNYARANTIQTTGAIVTAPLTKVIKSLNS